MSTAPTVPPDIFPDPHSVQGTDLHKSVRNFLSLIGQTNSGVILLVGLPLCFCELRCPENFPINIVGKMRSYAASSREEIFARAQKRDLQHVLRRLVVAIYFWSRSRRPRLSALE